MGGLPFYAVLSLPILFAAGMCLFDTIDGCFMNFAYDWAFSKPIRKIYYNLTITGLSVFIALFIGTIEILGLIAQETNRSGGIWDVIEKFNINRAGFIIVGIFVATWIVALAIWHFGDIERKWETQAAQAYANAGATSRPSDGRAARSGEPERDGCGQGVRSPANAAASITTDVAAA